MKLAVPVFAVLSLASLGLGAPTPEPNPVPDPRDRPNGCGNRWNFFSCPGRGKR